jgi:hypothetical protein
MNPKTLQPPALLPDLSATIASLFVTKAQAPKDSAEIFAQVLDQYVERHFDLHWKKRLGNNNPTDFVLNIPMPTTAAELGGGIEQAIADGRRFKQKTLEQPDMLACAAAAALLGISRQAMNDRKNNNQAIGLSVAKRGVKYPAWQFEDAVAKMLPELLGLLRHRDPWGQYLFFVQAEPLLGGLTPLDAMRQKQGDAVKKWAARLAAEE